MKRILFLVVLLFPILCNAQTLTASDVVISGDSFSKVYDNDLDVNVKFGNANLWVAKSFKDYSSAVQYEDKVNHRLILKSVGTRELVSFAITIDCREDKFRVMTDAITVDGRPYGEYLASVPLKIAAIDEKIKALSESEEKAKCEKALKKWSPVQNHYKEAKKSLDAIENRIEKLKATREQIITEDAVKRDLADLFNSISSTISYVDSF